MVKLICKEIMDVYYFGMLEVMVGALVFEFLSDQIGRKHASYSQH